MELSVFEHVRTFGHDREFVPHREPTQTDAIPGSPAKIAVLKSRVEAGEQLHHPNDPNAESVLLQSRIELLQRLYLAEAVASEDPLSVFSSNDCKRKRALGEAG